MLSKYEIWHLSVFPSVFFLTEKWQGLTTLGLAQSAERLKALHHVLRMLGFCRSSVIILKKLAQPFQVGRVAEFFKLILIYTSHPCSPSTIEPRFNELLNKQSPRCNERFSSAQPKLQ